MVHTLFPTYSSPSSNTHNVVQFLSLGVFFCCSCSSFLQPTLFSSSPPHLLTLTTISSPKINFFHIPFLNIKRSRQQQHHHEFLRKQCISKNTKPYNWTSNQTPNPPSTSQASDPNNCHQIFFSGLDLPTEHPLANTSNVGTKPLHSQVCSPCRREECDLSRVVDLFAG